jgi:hypothetical protein
MKEYAYYSKSSTGWYYGLKLHMACDYQDGRPLCIHVSKSNLDDRQFLRQLMTNPQLFKHTGTMFVADKGYQAKWLENVAKETGNYLLTGKKKSTTEHILASCLDIYLLHTRSRVETVFSNLKLNYNLTSTRSRSPLGYMFTYLQALHALVTKNEGR